MRPTLVYYAVIICANSPAVIGQQHNMSHSPEFRLRKTLLSSYDKMVRPVLEPSDVVQVDYNVQFQALNAVDNKGQTITTDMMITQVGYVSVLESAT
ncbi:neuronal acetylcholine receptor subunit beta-3-like [Stylophora pistillata]|uniref:neuronal acetylcholine receptor subunit beta-3-like n=1 Tax=Stylophora pistillata TaxID=50429 RepID=UPI000C048CF1|nr:neuronal acetylcholine receptor subunit beta-3-like [Stylophora pistillata]